MLTNEKWVWIYLQKNIVLKLKDGTKSYKYPAWNRNKIMVYYN